MLDNFIIGYLWNRNYWTKSRFILTFTISRVFIVLLSLEI
jgi:hypothetical protein